MALIVPFFNQEALTIEFSYSGCFFVCAAQVDTSTFKTLNFFLKKPLKNKYIYEYEMYGTI